MLAAVSGTWSATKARVGVNFTPVCLPTVERSTPFADSSAAALSALEEAGRSYSVRNVEDQNSPAYRAQQPFGQVPFLDDGGLEMFESGAGLLHLARKSEALTPADPRGEAETLQWTIAALNSIEMVSVPWWFLTLSGDADNKLTGWLGQRLDQLEQVLSAREWLAAGRFTVADLLMTDVLRVPKVRAFGERPATEAYVNRATQRPAFRKARADQLALYEAADRKRADKGSS